MIVDRCATELHGSYPLQARELEQRNDGAASLPALLPQQRPLLLRIARISRLHHGPTRTDPERLSGSESRVPIAGSLVLTQTDGVAHGSYFANAAARTKILEWLR